MDDDPRAVSTQEDYPAVIMDNEKRPFNSDHKLLDPNSSWKSVLVLSQLSGMRNPSYMK
jgi:hypothetical protein